MIFPAALADLAVIILAIMGIWLGAAIVHNPAAYPYPPEPIFKGALVLIELAIVTGCCVYVEGLKGRKLEEGWKEHIRFGDSAILTPRLQWTINKTVNEYYDYMSALGLDVELRRTLIKVDIGFNSCTPATSSLADTATIPPGYLTDRQIIAAKYGWCSLYRRIVGDEALETPRWHNLQLSAFTLTQYFPASFSDKEPASKSHDVLLDALWRIRSVCGKKFTDTSLAMAIAWMSSGGNQIDKPFKEFFFDQMIHGMAQIRTFGENAKFKQAVDILRSAGFGPKPDPQ